MNNKNEYRLHYNVTQKHMIEYWKYFACWCFKLQPFNCCCWHQSYLKQKKKKRTEQDTSMQQIMSDSSVKRKLIIIFFYMHCVLLLKEWKNNFKQIMYALSQLFGFGPSYMLVIYSIGGGGGLYHTKNRKQSQQ